MSRRLKLLCVVKTVKHLDIVNTADFLAISTRYFGLVHVLFMREVTFGWHFKFIPVNLVVLVGVLSYKALRIEAVSNASGSLIYKFLNSLSIPI